MIHIYFSVSIDPAVNFQGNANFKCKISVSKDKGVSTAQSTILSAYLPVCVNTTIFKTAVSFHLWWFLFILLWNSLIFKKSQINRAWIY